MVHEYVCINCIVYSSVSTEHPGGQVSASTRTYGNQPSFGLLQQLPK